MGLVPCGTVTLMVSVVCFGKTALSCCSTTTRPVVVEKFGGGCKPVVICLSDGSASYPAPKFNLPARACSTLIADRPIESLIGLSVYNNAVSCMNVGRPTLAVEARLARADVETFVLGSIEPTDMATPLASSFGSEIDLAAV